MAVLLLLATLHRNDGDPSIVRLLRRWSIAFAAVTCLAFPVFTQDFFLSMAWGRMLAAGINPFHNLFTSDILVGLPLDHFPMVSSYGPLWTILSGAVMLLTGGRVLAAAIVFKAILLAAWIWSLLLVEAITERRPVADRCLATVAFGWVPVGVLQTLAEGHNDIVMIWFVLLWLLLLLRARTFAPVALVASALAKYATAPLFLVDAIVAWRALPWRLFVLRYVAPAIAGAIGFGAFFRSLQFFDGTRTISEWHFLQPRDALGAIERALHVSLAPLEYLIAAAFAVLVAYQLVALYRYPAYETTAKASLALMCAVLFAGIAHLWPWYLVWTLAIGALVPAWWLSRLVVGVSILAPFTLVVWWIELFPNSANWASFAMYTIALIWLALTRIPGPPSDLSPAADRSFGRP
jgi:hypothetical protein